MTDARSAARGLIDAATQGLRDYELKHDNRAPWAEMNDHTKKTWHDAFARLEETMIKYGVGFCMKGSLGADRPGGTADPSTEVQDGRGDGPLLGETPAKTGRDPRQLSAARACTCHPDDDPPVPCAERYALSHCRAASAARALIAPLTRPELEALCIRLAGPEMPDVRIAAEMEMMGLEGGDANRSVQEEPGRRVRRDTTTPGGTPAAGEHAGLIEEAAWKLYQHFEPEHVEEDPTFKKAQSWSDVPDRPWWIDIAKDVTAAALREYVAEIAAYEQQAADHRRNVRLIDVAMHGDEGAARQASTCDLIDPAHRLRVRAEKAEHDRDEAVKLLSEVEVHRYRGLARSGWGIRRDQLVSACGK